MKKIYILILAGFLLAMLALPLAIFGQAFSPPPSSWTTVMQSTANGTAGALAPGNYYLPSGVNLIVDGGNLTFENGTLGGVQPLNSNLNILSGNLPGSFGLTLLQQTSQGNAQTALGLGSLALLNTLPWSDLTGVPSPVITASGDATGTATLTTLGNATLSLTLTNSPSTRTDLGLAIGANVQAYNANLTTFAGISPSASAQAFLSATGGNAGVLEAIGAGASGIAILSLNEAGSPAVPLMGSFSGATANTQLGYFGGNLTGLGIAPIAIGGTGLTSVPSGEFLSGNGTGALIPVAYNATTVAANLGLYAPLASPQFTGTVAAPAVTLTAHELLATMNITNGANLDTLAASSNQTLLGFNSTGNATQFTLAGVPPINNTLFSALTTRVYNYQTSPIIFSSAVAGSGSIFYYTNSSLDLSAGTTASSAVVSWAGGNAMREPGVELNGANFTIPGGFAFLFNQPTGSTNGVDRAYMVLASVNATAVGNLSTGNLTGNGVGFHVIDSAVYGAFYNGTYNLVNLSTTANSTSADAAVTWDGTGNVTWYWNSVAVGHTSTGPTGSQPDGFDPYFSVVNGADATDDEFLIGNPTLLLFP